MGRRRLLRCAAGWAAWSLAAAASSPSKKLVFFAGPHKAASKSVEKFFHSHASGFGGAAIAEGLSGWRWPVVEEGLLWTNGHPIEPREAFNALVTESSNATAQRLLRTSIRTAWDESEFGVVLGTPEFDRVGKTPLTHRDGLRAMRGVVEHLRLSHEDVTVVLNYRTPRRDQWISLWKHLERTTPYAYWLCNGNHDEQLEVVGTALDPLRLAGAYRDESWRVVLIDMGGVEKEGLDVSHVLACDVLSNTTCDGGFVVPVSETYNENAVGELFVHPPSDSDQEELEKLFRERDCYYRDRLRADAGFEVLHEDSLWENCNTDEKSESLYGNYTDPNTILDAMKSQRNCSQSGADIPGLLVGTYDDLAIDAPIELERRGGGRWFWILVVLAAIGFGVHYAKQRSDGVVGPGHFEMRNMPRGIGSAGSNPRPKERYTQIGEWI